MLGGHFLQALPTLMPGFDKEIARLAQRVLINPRNIDYHTNVLATKVTPGAWPLCVLGQAPWPPPPRSGGQGSAAAASATPHYSVGGGAPRSSGEFLRGRPQKPQVEL